MAGQIQCWINTFLLNSMGLLLWVAQANDGGMRIELQPQAFSLLPRVGSMPAHAVIRLLDDGPRSVKHYETLFSIDMERVMLKNGELDDLLIWHRQQMLSIQHRLSLDSAQGVVAGLKSENERISGRAAEAAQLAVALQESNDVEIARLKAELARLNADHREAPANAEGGALQAELEELRQENARLTSQLDDSRAENQALLDAGDKIDLTLGSDEDDSSGSSEALRSELVRVNADLHSLRKQNSELMAYNAQILGSFNECTCGNRITDSFNDAKCADCRNPEEGDGTDAPELTEAENATGMKECAKCSEEFRPRQAAYRYCRNCHQQHLGQREAQRKEQARARTHANNASNRPPRATKAAAEVAAPLPFDGGARVRQRNRRRRRPRANKAAAEAAAPLPSDGGGRVRQRNRRRRRPRTNKAAATNKAVAEAAAPLPADGGGRVRQRNRRRRRPRGRAGVDKAPPDTAPANAGGLGSRRTFVMVPNDAPPSMAVAPSPLGTGHAPPPALPAADLIAALEQMKKELHATIAQQLHEVQNQWQTNFDQLRQAAPEVVPAPAQSAFPQMPVHTLSPHHSYQGFGNNFYHPNQWPMSHMAAYPLSQLSPSYPPYATAGQGGSKA
jgi:hypothetical protein